MRVEHIEHHEMTETLPNGETVTVALDRIYTREETRGETTVYAEGEVVVGANAEGTHVAVIRAGENFS